MLQGLGNLLPGIERAGLDEGDVYRRERLYRTAPGLGHRPGLLVCPICGHSAVRFQRFGLAGRRNAQCPRCGSLERHRFLWLYLTAGNRFLQQRLRVLHTAPEPCLEPHLRKRPNLRYRSIDRFNPFADLTADLTDIPLPDASVDLVISCHVLEHIPDDRAAMRELARVLRPGGQAVIMVPNDARPVTEEGADVASPAERMRRFGHPYHYRNYGLDIVDRLAEAGLVADRVFSKRYLSGHKRRRFRINRNDLFHCRRPR